MPEKCIYFLRKLVKDEIEVFNVLIIILTIVIGIVVRVNFISGTEYPLNDGGYFYQMTEDLVSNQFKLPKYTSYNNAEIPFAYPPLAFYVVGVFYKIFSIPLISLFRYIPLIVSCLTIPFFYLLSSKFLDDKFNQILATYLFVTLPRSFEWFVMGGGVTRAFGFIFAILAIYFSWKNFENDKLNTNIIWASLFSALTILSHPVASLFLFFSIFVIFVYNYPLKIKSAAMMVGFILVLTSPWWITILMHHGLSPYLGATNTGHVNWFEVKNLITHNYGYENPYFLTLVSVLAFLGLFSSRKRVPLILGCFIVIGYVIIPRGGIDLLTVYLPILATFGFQVVADNWNIESARYNLNRFPNLLKSQKARIFFAFLVVYTFLGAYTYKYVGGKVNLHLEIHDVAAMEWLRDNTEKNATVLLIPPSESNRYWWNDYIAEWLPAISKRESVTTVQGYEWKPNVFADRIRVYTALRNCTNNWLVCVENWEEEYNLTSDYLFFEDRNIYEILGEKSIENSNLIIAYENEKVVILQSID